MANLLTYDTSDLTGDVTITDKQGTDPHHFDITVTGNGDGTFTDLKASYENWGGDWVADTPFNVSGNVATLTVYCSSGDEITITGKFEKGATPEPPTPIEKTIPKGIPKPPPLNGVTSSKLSVCERIKGYCDTS